MSQRKFTNGADVNGRHSDKFPPFWNFVIVLLLILAAVVIAIVRNL